MRGIILTKTGSVHVTKTRPELALQTDFIYADLATGGEISVPRENIESTEWYDDNQIETFRLRLKELGR